ncbi:MAG: hypothetical protein AAB903_00135 [Patescibacteria group bacterium]
MTIKKQITLSLSILLLVFLVSVPDTLARGARPGESRVCIGSGDVVIQLTLPCLQIGSAEICADADFAEECRRLGGRWGGVLPQYISPGRTNAPIQDVNSALQILVWFIRLAQIVFWILTVAFGLYAAYLYLFSGGSKEQVTQARRVLMYTVIAGIVSVIAYAIPGVIDSLAR